jgi:hypothetical protein
MILGEIVEIEIQPPVRAVNMRYIEGRGQQKSAKGEHGGDIAGTVKNPALAITIVVRIVRGRQFEFVVSRALAKAARRRVSGIVVGCGDAQPDLWPHQARIVAWLYLLLYCQLHRQKQARGDD